MKDVAISTVQIELLGNVSLNFIASNDVAKVENDDILNKEVPFEDTVKISLAPKSNGENLVLLSFYKFCRS